MDTVASNPVVATKIHLNRVKLSTMTRNNSVLGKMFAA